MRILITNDDGINARGLEVLHAIATEVAGPGGEVWTVAPAFEQSGVAHCISYTHPMLIARLDKRRFAAEGSPADCVLAGLYDVLQGEKPDLVLSGVNRGNNSGENAVYSGTLGGAMEAALQGLPAIALSQFMGPEIAALDDPFEAARTHGVDVVRRLLEHGFGPQDEDYRIFYSVNFPPLPAAEVKGIKAAAQGFRRDTSFGVEPHVSPSGKRFLWIRGGDQRAETAPDSDVALNLDGWISVTPMRADLTAHDALQGLGRALGSGAEPAPR
ncbi:5'/3'-nucleotidase SurE [Frigidibacter oleivorans]|uniref:5'/3'-nucleotidase SurE n=1 Tax=Frigidibacter oleivorans TaxID=2487129 RepID=UPI000F8C4505|nr:5'/3'-nucleotidase SurE [Frigidibacter oleivorans]